MRARMFALKLRNLSLALILVALFFLMAMPAPPAWAHKVNVFAYSEGGKVVAEAYFADGRKCRDSTVEVFDMQGNKLLEGKTDADGRFIFSAPTRADVLVRLTASMGHQAEYTVAAADLPGAEPPSSIPPRQAAAVGVPPAEREAWTEPVAGPDLAAVEQAVDRAIARQLVPLRRAFEQERERRRLLDIIGGIGYIIGLMGIIAYFRSRRTK